MPASLPFNTQYTSMAQEPSFLRLHLTNPTHRAALSIQLARVLLVSTCPAGECGAALHAAHSGHTPADTGQTGSGGCQWHMLHMQVGWLSLLSIDIECQTVHRYVSLHRHTADAAERAQAPLAPLAQANAGAVSVGAALEADIALVFAAAACRAGMS